MASPNIAELIVTALKANYSGKFSDNVGKGNLLLMKMRKRGNVRLLDGGTVIAENLEYAENSTAQRYSGYQPLDIAASDVLTQAEFEWKQAAVNVTVSGREERINSGKTRILPLVESRIKNAMRTMDNLIAEDMVSDGTADGGLQIGGLQLLIQDDPTTSSTVGGINQSTWSFWRNQVVDFSSDLSINTVASSNIRQGMNKLYLECSRGMDVPDLVYAGQTYYTYYEDSLQTNQRYTDAKLAEAGFETLKYKGADVICDTRITNLTAAKMYFINTEFMKFNVHQDANFVALENKVSVNQDATVVPVIFMGNLSTSNRSLHGVLKA